MGMLALKQRSENKRNRFVTFLRDHKAEEIKCVRVEGVGGEEEDHGGVGIEGEKAGVVVVGGEGVEEGEEGERRKVVWVLSDESEEVGGCEIREEGFDDGG